MSFKNDSETVNPFPENLVLEQLQKIFLCPVFSVSDILRRFLSYITQETLAGRSNTIKEYTIAVNVLNKPVSFKPQHDAIVRIHAGRLRRALNYYYKEQGVDDEIEISVPKGSYVPVFQRPHSTGLVLMQDSETVHLEESTGTITIAIMPFRTFETDISRQALADNLGEQLCAEFGKFSDFSVVSYYTTQQLSLKNREIQELASKFGAHYVVTGNVQFEARRVRVSAQLTDTHTGNQVWTELFHFNFNPTGYFEAADNIITGIIAVLGDFNGLIMQQVAKGLVRDKAGNPFSTVLSAYNEFYSNFTEEGFRKAYAAMEHAVEKNPENDLAWAFLGELSLVSFLFNQTSAENPLIHCLRCARRALKINPLSQHGYITLAMANIFLSNKKASLEALQHAIALNPNASGCMGVIGCLMICVGEYVQGMTMLEKSIEKNKSYPPFFNLFLSLYYFKQKEYSLAYQEAEKMSMPDVVLNTILLATSLSRMGRKSELDEFKKILNGYSLDKTWISREYIHRFLLDKDLVEELSRGLKSAKIPILTVA